jgi:ring-1,2-phenylacetyl-CoA epoxidase subunit PaaE
VKQFHQLRVAARTPEASDAMRVALDVPESLRDEYRFLPGQHLPVQIERGGKKLRRTYSICSPEDSWPLEIGVRIQPGGAFSEFVAGELTAGDFLDVMPPTGRFHLDAERQAGRFHVAFAAGSGITPVLSIVASLLRRDSDNRVALFYGNRKQSTTMFIDDLYALKNRYPERLQLHFVFSREEQEFDIAAGRLDGEKVAGLWASFCSGVEVDEAWVCGPDSMIDSVTDALVELGLPPERVHAERFGVPRTARAALASPAVSVGDAAEITVIMDGHRKRFRMSHAALNIVDAAADQGVELPYSCKGGVCATCRTHVQSGKVEMATNYGLEPWEVEQGYVLACQGRPLSDEVVLDYDKS